MKILIIDDDSQILDALSVGFQLQWKDAEVFSAADGETGLSLFFDRLPDVVLLDIGLPAKNGFEVLQEIRKASDVPVIILSARGHESDQVRGLELGADDYVVKPFGYMALIARIKAVLRRAEMPPPLRSTPDFVSGDLAINFEDATVTLRGKPVRVTPLEYKLLCQLVRNQGRLMPHETLINRIWGEDYGATTDHLKVFISRLRSKIEVGDGPRMIETERGLGYRFVGPHERQRRP
jgi:DNA-binding response OmpR family regulator